MMGNLNDSMSIPDDNHAPLLLAFEKVSCSSLSHCLASCVSDISTDTAVAASQCMVVSSDGHSSVVVQTLANVQSVSSGSYFGEMMLYDTKMLKGMMLMSSQSSAISRSSTVFPTSKLGE